MSFRSENSDAKHFVYATNMISKFFAEATRYDCTGAGGTAARSFSYRFEPRTQ